MSWTLCLSGPTITKAGVHVNSTIVNYGTNQTFLDKLSDEAEGVVCSDCHSDFVTNYSSYSTQIQNALSDACSSLIVMDLVSYDPTGYLAREADMIMNKCDERYKKALAILSKKENQRFSS